ncbi:MAG: hypothetical protein K2M17_01225 [Bacilli bacterium]|nr:hypothetical protein [Bacilli bacterium]
MKLNKTHYENLLKHPQNKWFKKSEEEKYAKFASKDPFPEIEKALLNANDVVKYVATAGILSPFVPDQLSGVTYTARFSGNMFFYESGGKETHICLKKDNEEFTLQPNSIYFLEIDTYFRVPDYMVLRYNLRVKNVYKGLLLGTGPIIDSGYQGKFFIPLHNLTSNTYIIQKGAKLIDIEFTKLSSRSDWTIGEKDQILKTIQNFDFSAIPQITNDFTGSNMDRPFGYYMENALTHDADFHNKDYGLYVNSSLQELKDEIQENKKQSDEEVKKLKNEVAEGISKSEKIQDEIKDSIDKSERRENFIKSFSILTVIAMLITAITMGITALDYFNKATELKIDYQYVEQAIEYNDQRVDAIMIIVDAMGGEEELSDELYEKYQGLIEQISTANRELEEKRNSSKEKLLKTNNLILFFSVAAIVLASFACTYIYIYHNRIKKNNKGALITK